MTSHEMTIPPFYPMEPVIAEQPFDSERHIFQVKWDGVRCLAYADTGGVRLFNRRLNEKTTQYPELLEALQDMPPGTVLDGEIVAPGQDGKPSLYRVLERDQLKSPASIHAQRKSIPIIYMAFDVIFYKGKCIAGEPLVKRQEMLKELIHPGDCIHLVESITGRGRALFDAVSKEGMEGIVAKEAQSPYLIGKKNRLWQKIKSWREMEALVCGWVKENGRLRSLIFGEMQGGEIVYIGNASSGLGEKYRQQFQRYLSAEYGDRLPCPFTAVPAVKGAVWTLPEIKLRVRFLEWSGDYKMRNPVIMLQENL